MELVFFTEKRIIFELLFVSHFGFVLNGVKVLATNKNWKNKFIKPKPAMRAISFANDPLLCLLRNSFSEKKYQKIPKEYSFKFFYLAKNFSCW